MAAGLEVGLQQCGGCLSCRLPLCPLSHILHGLLVSPLISAVRALVTSYARLIIPQSLHDMIHACSVAGVPRTGVVWTVGRRIWFSHRSFPLEPPLAGCADKIFKSDDMDPISIGDKRQETTIDKKVPV